MQSNGIAKKQQVEDIQPFWPIMIAIFFGAFISVLNTSTINIAIPSLMDDFHSPIHIMQWTLTGFMLAAGLSAPLSGYLCDRFGAKNVYVLVLLGVALASVLCALAWNPLSLILFRIVQGFFCGVIMPITMTIIYEIFDTEKHAFAISLWSVAAWMGPAFGPTMAGIILEYASWQWIFIVNIPLALLSMILAIRLIPIRGHLRKPRLDVSGLILVLYCSFALLLMFSEAPSWGLTNWKTILCGSTGLLTSLIFIWRELRAKEPLLNIRVFKKKRFSISVIISSITTVSLFAGVYLVPLFMQTVQGVSPLLTGIILLPASLMMMLVMPIVGKLYHKVGPVLLTCTGLVIIAYSQWKLHQLSPTIESTYILWWMLVRNIGLAFSSAPVTSAGMEVISKELIGHASAINNWTRQIVSSLAIGLFTAVYATRQVIHLDTYDGGKGSSEDYVPQAMAAAMNDVFLLSTIIVVIAIPLSFWLGEQKMIRNEY